MVTSLPAWLVRDMEAWLAYRPTGHFTVYAREGDVTGVDPGGRKGPPIGEYPVPPPCARCGAALEVLDNGRRFCCHTCTEVWTEIEYRTLVTRAFSKGGDRHGQEEAPEGPQAHEVPEVLSRRSRGRA